METDTHTHRVSRIAQFITNPNMIPHIVNTLAEFHTGAKEVFSNLRQLSCLNYNAFSAPYFDEVHKTLTIEPRKDLSEPWDLVSQMSLEFAYIYRKLVIKDLTFMDPETGDHGEELFEHILSLVPYLKEIEIYFDEGPFPPNPEEDRNIVIERLRSNCKWIVLLFQKLFGKCLNLKILKIRNPKSYGYIYPRELLSLIPPTARIVLSIESVRSVFHCFSLEELQQNYPKSLTMLIKRTIIRSESEANMLTSPKISDWCEVTNSRMFNVSIHYGMSQEFTVTKCVDELVRIWKVIGIEFYGDGWSRFGMQRLLQVPGIWKEHITTLSLKDFSDPLDFLGKFPKLDNLVLREIPVRDCLFLDTNKTDEENLRSVFGGLTNLKISFYIAPGQERNLICEGSPLALFIGTLVREFIVK